MEDVTLLFPTPLYSNNIGVDYPIPLNILFNVDKTNNDGGISVDQEYLLKTKLLKERIDKEIEIYLRKYLRLKTTVGLKHQCSWILVHQKGDFSPKHYHRNSWLSGIYYYKVNSNSGQVEFINTPPFGWTCSSMDPVDEVEEFSLINSNEYAITPREGDLFLFPSQLVHKSYPNESDDDRICISFNYTLHGTWGVPTSIISI
tara:strand:+ start:642 stop:1247 length:606 start_codon:yes stop_codon:yes gene_type:complete